MTTATIHFIVQNMALALFYLSYRLFFARDTFLQTKRIYLQFSFLFSLYLPIINITGWFEKEQVVQKLIPANITLPEITVAASKASFSWDTETVFWILYLAISAIFVIRFLFRLAVIIRMRRAGEKTLIHGTKVIVLKRELAPFSFWNWIFINPALHTGEELKEILTHESIHTGQGHSGDVILSELMVILFWINPFTWLLRREIRQNLEFIADNKVLESGIDSKSYQYHLLQLSYQSPNVKLVNKFNVSPLKKRIIMMNQQKTSKAGILKYSLIIPLALALLATSNANSKIGQGKDIVHSTNGTINDSDTLEKTKAPLKSTVKLNAPKLNQKTLDNHMIYNEVEKMPQFPGGDKELINYLVKNTKYPEDAQKAGIQGRVIVEFIVNTTGKVEQPKVAQSTMSPAIGSVSMKPGSVSTMSKKLSAFEQEALRVVNAMPQWIPGEQKGKKVAVRYTLPIQFSLMDNQTKTGESVVILDGKQMPVDFNINSIKPENIAKMNVIHPSSETEKQELIKKYGQAAVNGVIEVTTKK